MVLITKRNVTTELLESVRDTNFLLLTPVGITEVKLESTINSHGMYKHGVGIMVVHAQGPHLAFSDSVNTVLHGAITELVEYIKDDDYVLVPQETCDG